MATIVALDEFTLELVRGSSVFNLSSGTLANIMDYSGLGSPPATNFFERAPLQDGSTRRGYRFDPRAFQITFYVHAACLTTRQRNMNEFLDILGLSDSLLIFRFILPDGDVRQLDFTLESSVDLASGDRISRLRDYGSVLVGQFVAPDPTFYEPTAQTSTFALADSTGFSIPTPVPTPIGEDTLNVTQAILYTGSANSYPTIRINGPIIDPVLTNNTTSTTIQFVADTEIVNGDYWDIDTKAGTITDASGTNQLAALSTSSSLALFYLLREREAPNGNSITVTGTRVSGATSIVFTYYIRHGSLY